MGVRVWLFTPKTTARSRKLQQHWTGPWTVEQEISPVLFRVRSGPWNVNQIDVTAGLDRLRRYHARGEPPVAEQSLDARDVDTTDEFIEQMYKNASSGDWSEFADEAKRLKWIDHIATSIHETSLLKNPDVKM